MIVPALLYLAPLLLFILVSLTWKRRKAGVKYDVPGPRGIPLLGNAHQLGQHPNQTYMRWAEQYGEIYKIRLGWYDWYMLNTPEAVKEVMDRQSSLTSSRVPMPVTSDALSGGLRFLMMPYGPEWRKLRSLAHKLLTLKMSDTFKPSQNFEAKQLLHDILTDNENCREFYMHIRRYSVSVIMTSTYGIRVPKWDCEDVRVIYRVMKDFSDVASPGTYLADIFTPLANLPRWMQWWRKGIEPMFKRQATIWLRYWDRLKSQLDTGSAPECFVKQMMKDDYEKQGISELQAAFLAGSMIEAGSETTSATLNSITLYLAAYPDVQKKAYAEISQVIGDERSPDFGDEQALPYTRALIKEVLRLRPITNIGSPHFTTADVRYKDYVIPKNSVVCMQQYPIHYDKSRYPEPSKFKPERYLGHSQRAGYYAAIANPYERDHFTFGAGRRICTGLHLAENSLFITVAKLLWAFEIRPALDATGQELHVDVSDSAYEPGLNTVTKPFSMRFIPRNEKVAKVIRQEWSVAQREGYTLRSVKVDSHGVVVG